jgi:hypothetical protein
MPLPFLRQKALFKACDPATPLEPGDTRFVDVDAFGGRGSSEGADWVSQLATTFALADDALRVLVSGLPGTGKSTELRRLADRLRTDDHGGYLVCLVDAEELLDLRAPIAAEDILLAIVIALERTLDDAEGKEAPARKATTEGHFARIWRSLTDRDVELKEISASLSVASVKAELKQSSHLRALVRRSLAKDYQLFQTEVTEACRAFLARAVSLGHQGLVVLFDSLEKLRGDMATFDAVLTSAERLFMSGAPQLALPVHALYAVPPALSLRLKNIDVLPMLKVHDRDGREHEPGIAAARALIRARIPDDDLAELVEADEREAVIRQIILATGGYPRDLVRVLRLLVQAPKHPLSRREITRILTTRAGEIRDIAAGQGLAGKKLLARVHAFQRIEPEPGELAVADRFLAQSLILGYADDERWVDVHPAVLALPGFSELVELARQTLAHELRPAE